MGAARRAAGIVACAVLACVPLPAQAAAKGINEPFNRSAKPGTVARIYSDVLWTGAEFGNAAGRYDDANISAHDGKLDLFLRGGRGAYVAFDPTFKGTTHGRYRFSIKSDGPGTGYGVAVLLWPKGDDEHNGEVDLIEGDLDKHLHIYQHAVGAGCRPDGYCPNTNIVDMKAVWKGSGWHQVDTTWTAAKLVIKIDGKTQLSTTKNVPIGPHALIVQAAKQDEATKTKDTHVLLGQVRIDP